MQTRIYFKCCHLSLASIITIINFRLTTMNILNWLFFLILWLFPPLEISKSQNDVANEKYHLTANYGPDNDPVKDRRSLSDTAIDISTRVWYCWTILTTQYINGMLGILYLNHDQILWENTTSSVNWINYAKYGGLQYIIAVITLVYTWEIIVYLSLLPTYRWEGETFTWSFQIYSVSINLKLSMDSLAIHCQIWQWMEVAGLLFELFVLLCIVIITNGFTLLNHSSLITDCIIQHFRSPFVLLL